MRVNTAELKNDLSRYLRHLRETGEPITVCDRNKPVARLVPLDAQGPSTCDDAGRERRALLARARKLGIKLRLPKDKRPMRQLDVEAEIAEDRRTDVPTIDWVRGGRTY